MSVIYRVIKLSSNPLDKNAPIKFYPRAITLGKSVNLKFMVDKIHERSSLSRGDVRSVINNFVEKLKEQLLEGKSVNIEGLGVFSLSLRSKGEMTEKEVTAKSVSSVKICFLASKDLRINKTATRASERLDLVRLDEYMEESAETPETPETPDTEPNGKPGEQDEPNKDGEQAA